MGNNEKVKDIINSILRFYYISEEELLSKSRVAHVVEARQMLAFYLRKKTGFSYSKIGEILKRDHTTIMHACDRAVELLEKKDGRYPIY